MVLCCTFNGRGCKSCYFVLLDYLLGFAVGVVCGLMVCFDYYEFGLLGWIVIRLLGWGVVCGLFDCLVFDDV